MRWRELSDEDREREYSPSSCTGGSFQIYIDQYVERSQAARDAAVEAAMPIHVIEYGPEPTQTIDLVVPAATSVPVPVVVYIHGGYWQLLSKHESLFAAPDALSNGWAYAAVDYTLAPDASLDEIVAECRSAVTKIRDMADVYGLDADAIFVAGSSAGAHLSAMVGLGLSDGWRPAGLGLVSGVFELEPLVGTTINDAVGLDRKSAQRNSPLLADVVGMPPALLAWGDNETEEFKRQSRSLRAVLADAGSTASEIEIDGRNHFDVVLDLCNRDTSLGAAFAGLIDSVTTQGPTGL